MQNGMVLAGSFFQKRDTRKVTYAVAEIVNNTIQYNTIKFSSPVNMSPKSPNLDKIATETLFVGNDSHTNPEQHIKNIEQSK